MSNFDLKLIQFPTLERVSVEGKEGRYYSTPDGVFPSVTTIIGKMSDKSYLDEWRDKIGEEQANLQSHLASSRGSFIHEGIEDFLLSRDQRSKNYFYQNLLNAFKRELSCNLGEIYGIECMLYSTKLRAAGTADLIAFYDGKLCLLDYKTSNKEKFEIEEYYIQAGFYAYMFYERTGIPINNLTILLGIEEDDKIKTFTSKSREYILKAVEMSRKFYED